jgi:DNA polymerase
MNPRYVFVAEAPGERESATRKPMIGPAGQVMARLLTHVGLDRREVFITNVVKYRPIQGSITIRNRTPSMPEQLASRVYLMRELAVFDATPVITFGRVATDALGLYPATMHQMHGRVWNDEDRMYGAMYHPATVVYDPAMYDTLANDLAAIIRNIGDGR